MPAAAPVVSNINNNDDGNDDDIIEKLILAVQTREPIWNYRMPLERRTKPVIEMLWEEIKTEVNC